MGSRPLDRAILIRFTMSNQTAQRSARPGGRLRDRCDRCGPGFAFIPPWSGFRFAHPDHGFACSPREGAERREAQARLRAAPLVPHDAGHRDACEASRAPVT